MNDSITASTVLAQLHEALLRKEVLAQQLEEVSERVKALRNLHAGIEIGQKLPPPSTKE